MAWVPNNLDFLVPTFILLGGVIDDLHSRKIHNWLVLTAMFIALVFQIHSGGWEALKWGLLGFAMAGLICLPVVLARMLGAGDMKLMMAFGLSTSVAPVIEVTLFSLIWGSIMGILQALFRRDLKVLLKNTLKIVQIQMKETQKIQYHTIPYTVALFFGWLTHLTLKDIGFHLW